MKQPNPTYHFIISILKSLLRIGACAVSIVSKSFLPLAYGLMLAEIVGIIEECI